jgi:hypothetical protein
VVANRAGRASSSGLHPATSRSCGLSTSSLIDIVNSFSAVGILTAQTTGFGVSSQSREAHLIAMAFAGDPDPPVLWMGALTTKASYLPSAWHDLTRSSSHHSSPSAIPKEPINI